MALDLKTVFEAQKTLAMTPPWVERDSEALEVVCPLEIDGVVVEGFSSERLQRSDCQTNSSQCSSNIIRQVNREGRLQG